MYCRMLVRRRLVAFAIGLTLVLCIGHARPVETASPVQTSSAADLEAYIEELMTTYNIPGLAIAIVRDGEVVYLQGFGVANDRGDRVTPETPFLLASLSKSFTAVGVMQMVGEGALRLDDPVRRHLPWFSTTGPEGEDVTVAHLLHQTSGFTELDGIRATLRPDAPNALEAGVRDLSPVRFERRPGLEFEYSNINYNVLGLLIQEVSGRSYEAYIRERVFTPLGMDRSYASLVDAEAAGAAAGYYPFFGRPIVYVDNMPYSRATLPAAGLWSTASDMSRYLIAHLNAGYDGNVDTWPGPDSTVLHASGVQIEPGLGYAMGWYRAEAFLAREHLETLETDLRNHDDMVTLFHEGDWANYKSVALLLPALDYGVVMLMNLNDPTVASALRFAAWDVTLIATGGEAQHFPPTEDAIVRYSRWFLGAIALVLLAEMAWSLHTLGRIRREDARGMLWRAGVFLVIDVVLIVYLYSKLLPENAMDLLTLIHHAPDLGMLVYAITLLAAGWGTARTFLVSLWAWKRHAWDVA